MRSLIAASFLLCGLASPSAHAQQATHDNGSTPQLQNQRHAFGAEDTTTIHIRLMNGKTGQPIADKEIFLERNKTRLMSHAEEKDIKTDVSGLAEATVPKTGDILNPIVVDYRSCTPRTKRAGDTEKTQRFSIDQVLTTGLVAQNTCGKATQTATPGELVLYFRTMNLFEHITD